MGLASLFEDERPEILALNDLVQLKVDKGFELIKEFFYFLILLHLLELVLLYLLLYHLFLFHKVNYLVDLILVPQDRLSPPYLLVAGPR